MCVIYGRDVLTEETFQRCLGLAFVLTISMWLFVVASQLRDEFLMKAESYRRLNSQHIAKKPDIIYQILLNHLKKAGYEKSRCLGVPQVDANEFTPPKHNEIKPFSKQLITADQKWVTYDNGVPIEERMNRDVFSDLWRSSG